MIWNNSTRMVDYGVFGRYVAIGEATGPHLLPGRRCLVQPPRRLLAAWEPGYVVGNAFDDASASSATRERRCWAGALSSIPICHGRRSIATPVATRWRNCWTLARHRDRGLGAEIVFPMITLEDDHARSGVAQRHLRPRAGAQQPHVEAARFLRGDALVDGESEDAPVSVKEIILCPICGDVIHEQYAAPISQGIPT